jgi:branched-chain amino acid transport system substrate-binding protein
VGVVSKFKINLRKAKKGGADLQFIGLSPGMTDAVLGITTAYHYSAVHDSPINKSFVASFKNAYCKRPNAVAVSGYDGMHLIFEALKKTGGKADGDEMIAAIQEIKWESPRGPMEIDPRTRDVVHNEYNRRVERLGNCRTSNSATTRWSNGQGGEEMNSPKLRIDATL